MYNTNDKSIAINTRMNKNENQNQNELDWANHFIIYMLAREPDRLLSSDWTGKRIFRSSLLIGWRGWRDLIYRRNWPIP